LKLGDFCDQQEVMQAWIKPDWIRSFIIHFRSGRVESLILWDMGRLGSSEENRIRVQVRRRQANNRPKVRIQFPAKYGTTVASKSLQTFRPCDNHNELNKLGKTKL